MTSALISPAELHQLLETQTGKVALLDASYAIGAAGHAPDSVFANMRIDHAQFFDIDAIADPENPLPHMLPSDDDFAAAVGALGISNDHLVIAYDQSGIAMAAARAWWMFRVFGHDRVRVLDGGLPAWTAAGFDLTHGAPDTPEPQVFTATLRPELVTTYAQMKNVVTDKSAAILDARPPERFAGLSPEPRPGLQAGHMPGALSVPAGSLIDAHTRGMIAPSRVKSRLADLNLQPSAPIVTTCGSGVTACVVALALFDQNYENVSVYDGSWSEWGREELNSPIVKGIE